MKKLLTVGCKVTSDLHWVFQYSQAVMVRAIAVAAAKQKPAVLLQIETVRQVHPTNLLVIYEAVAQDENAARNMRAAVREMVQSRPLSADSAAESANEREVVDFVAHMIRFAPDAAVILLERIFLQAPIEVQKHRNPVPFQCVLRNDIEQMNTIYALSCEWTPQVNFERPQWQRELIKGHGQHVEFCSIRVLLIQGIITMDVFDAILSLPYAKRTEMFTKSIVLRAIVDFSWSRFAKRFDSGCPVAGVGCLDVLCGLIERGCVGMLLGNRGCNRHHVCVDGTSAIAAIDVCL